MKTIKILLGLSLLAFSVTGCVTIPIPGGHTHTYSDSWSSDDLHHWHAATCEHTSEVKDKAEHTFEVWIIDIPATESSEGYKHRICSICAYRQDQTIEKLEHVHVPDTPVSENMVEPTCTNPGSYDLVTYCKGCKEELSRETISISPTGHQHLATRVENEVSPTCTEDGSFDSVTYCLDDNVVVETKHEIVPSTGHNLIHHDGQAATCTEDGWLEYDTCSKCDYSTFQIIPATNHPNQEVREESRIEATCTEDGSYDLVTYCLDENIVLSSEHIVLKATGHDLIHHDGQAATCTEDGWLEYDTCSKCDYSTYQKIDATGHLYGEPTYVWSSDYSSCTATRVCLNDPSHNERETVESVYEVVNEATVSEDGLGRYTASFTNTTFEKQVADEIIDATGSLDKLSFRLLSTGKYAVSAINTSIEGEVYIPKKYNKQPVTTIYENAFKNCSSITDVYISDNVTTIENYAFSSCGKLKNIRMSSNVYIIGLCVFDFTNNINYNVYKESNYLGNEDNPYLVLVSRIKKNVFTCEIYDRCRGIMPLAFQNTAIAQITIPESVKFISNNAFQNALHLTEVINKSSLNIQAGESNYGLIAKFALQVIDDISKSKLILSSDGYVTYDDGNDVWFVEYLGNEKNVVIPSGVTIIKKYAFYTSTTIESVTFPDGVRIIEENMFYFCTNLMSISLPSSVKEIGRSFIEACDKLQFNEYVGGYYLGNEDNPYHVFVNPIDLEIETLVINENCGIVYGRCSGCSKLAKATLNQKVNYILDAFFYGCESLSSIVIPDCVTKIGEEAFRECSSLVSIDIPDNVASIGQGAFRYCTSLVSASLSDNMYKINFNLFSWCKNLASIDFGTGITIIDDSAFAGCSSFINLVIPDTVESIGQQAFEQCVNLRRLTLGNSLKTIQNYAFLDCRRLVSVNLPASLTKIEISAFSGCYQLVEVINNSSLNIEVGSNKYGHVAENAKQVITDPSETRLFMEDDFLLYDDEEDIWVITYYGNEAEITLPSIATKVNQYALYSNLEIISLTIPDNITFIGSNAFCACSLLSKVVIGNGVTELDELAFSTCPQLVDLTIGENVEIIGARAFHNCRKLTEISIPNSVITLGTGAFLNCESLVSITIPGNVKSIGSYAFSKCTSLESVTLEHGVGNIYYDAFYNCTSLTYVYLPTTISISSTYSYYIFNNCTSLKELYFEGTVDQWNALGKCSSWNAGSSITTVHCSNGDVTL